MNSNSLVNSGIAPGHNSATGFPVRSYHLSGLLDWTAVKGELLHLTNTLFVDHSHRTVNDGESMAAPVRCDGGVLGSMDALLYTQR